jgi:hypothetical protein
MPFRKSRRLIPESGFGRFLSRVFVLVVVFKSLIVTSDVLAAFIAAEQQADCSAPDSITHAQQAAM